MAFSRRAIVPALAVRHMQAPTRNIHNQFARQRPTTVQRAVWKGVRPAFVPLRWQSSATANEPKVYDFHGISQLIRSPSPDKILIDVREPSEYQEGYIASAVNIPIKSQPDALFLPEPEFEDRFGFSKPAIDAEVVFYCKSGVRSRAAALLAQQHGYGKVAEYSGSWLDWQKQGGAASKS